MTKHEGPAAAAVLAAGVGALILGLLTTLASASESFANGLVLNVGVGPLSGKTTYAVAAWLISWLILHPALRKQERMSAAILSLGIGLLALGLLGTFPPFFEAFATH